MVRHQRSGLVKGRVEQRLFKLNDEIEALRREERLVAEELRIHRHIDDDAQRDAVVGEDWVDRSFARASAADVARFERVLTDLGVRRRKLEAKRDLLLQRLSDL